ncbi:MAG: dihydrodipicolinate synthase family protein [Lentisphaerae bacterium]|nr:dihydrodipicolinate synthase family protein [Lentisphaerota bacterium]
MTLEELKHAFTGPIPTLNIPFTRDGAIDYNGLNGFIDFLVAARSRAIVLTLGDSLLTLLTDQEVAEVTKAVVDMTAGRAVVVAADKPWPTAKAGEFARYAREVGADAVMTLPADWAASCTAEGYVAHYAAAARHLPVMLVTGVLIPRGMHFALEVIRRTLEQVPGVFCVKDDFCGEFAQRMTVLVKDRWAVWSGGLKQNHLNLWPYGCHGYLSTFLKFKPEVAWTYWRAIERRETAAAVAVLTRHEIPLFDFISGLPGNFSAGIHGALELFGVAPRWRRAPYHSLTDAELDRLAGFFKTNGLL